MVGAVNRPDSLESPILHSQRSELRFLLTDVSGMDVVFVASDIRPSPSSNTGYRSLRETGEEIETSISS